ncbi:hypothetical protein C8Q76DRAFT_860578 [Earliella scabrosa]|nr:hypothetical protein C8Q76DRAFT_860578 [Earliella scabrosa]
MHICYHYLVSNYLNPTAFLTSVWTVQVLPLSTGVTALLTQGFYLRRVYLVGPSYRIVAVLVGIFMLAELGFIISSAIDSFGNSSFEGLGDHVWIDATLFAIATAVDLALTGTLVLILRRSRTRFRQTNMVLDSLALYAVIATSLNTALTLPAFICSIALPGTFVYFAIAIPATKVYSNSVLAVLNCRNALANRAARSEQTAVIPLRHLRDTSRRAGGTLESRTATSSHTMVHFKSMDPEKTHNTSEHTKVFENSLEVTNGVHYGEGL